MKKLCLLLFLSTVATFTLAQPTQKPPLHGKNWMAITGKPLAATEDPLFLKEEEMP